MVTLSEEAFEARLTLECHSNAYSEVLDNDVKVELLGSVFTQEP